MNRMAVLATSIGVLAGSHVWAAEGTGVGFMETWDLDNDGMVSLEEAQRGRTALFAKYDTNGDGLLDAAEYKKISMGGQKTRSAAPVEGQVKNSEDASMLMGLDLNDINGDGQVSAGEFMSNSGAWVDLMDDNKDGGLTAEEFETKWQDRDARINLRDARTKLQGG